MSNAEVEGQLDTGIHFYEADSITQGGLLALREQLINTDHPVAFFVGDGEDPFDVHRAIQSRPVGSPPITIVMLDEAKRSSDPSGVLHEDVLRTAYYHGIEKNCNSSVQYRYCN